MLLAARVRNKFLVTLLLENGADINTTSKDVRNPIECLSAQSHRIAACLLIFNREILL